MRKFGKCALILISVLFLCVVSYFIFCPVLTIGGILEKENFYHPNEIRIISFAPKDCPQSGSLSSESGEEIWLSELQETENFCNLLYSLKVRKKLGKSHWLSQNHFDEPAYEYEILFCHDQGYFRIRLCLKEFSYKIPGNKRYSSYDFNTYYLINCPENIKHLKEIQNFLSKKVL